MLDWLVDAAQPLTAFSAYGLCELHVTQLQLNEFYAVLRAVKEGAMREGKAIQRVSRSPHWVWVALAPVTKLRGAIDIGKRTLALAQRCVPHGAQGLAPEGAPLFVTDGFGEYATAVLTHSGPGGSRLGVRPQGLGPSRAGCPCRRCSMRRWARPRGGGAESTSRTGWSLARWKPSLSCCVGWAA